MGEREERFPHHFQHLWIFQPVGWRKVKRSGGLWMERLLWTPPLTVPLILKGWLGSFTLCLLGCGEMAETHCQSGYLSLIGRESANKEVHLPETMSLEISPRRESADWRLGVQRVCGKGPGPASSGQSFPGGRRREGRDWVAGAWGQSRLNCAPRLGAGREMRGEGGGGEGGEGERRKGWEGETCRGSPPLCLLWDLEQKGELWWTPSPAPWTPGYLSLATLSTRLSPLSGCAKVSQRLVGCNNGNNVPSKCDEVGGEGEWLVLFTPIPAGRQALSPSEGKVVVPVAKFDSFFFLFFLLYLFPRFSLSFVL